MRYYLKIWAKTAIMSLEKKLKMFFCIKTLGFAELKRQKTFLPLNIINIQKRLSRLALIAFTVNIN